MAILMNFENGRDLFNELVQPRLTAAGFPDAVLTPELKLPARPVKFDAARYVRDYENVRMRMRMRVAKTIEGLTLSQLLERDQLFRQLLKQFLQ